MYEDFYGLNRKPFSKTPDPEFLYMSRKHAEALARMQYAVEEKEIMMLTGEIGTGKTTLARALLDQLDDEEFVKVLIINPILSPYQLLRNIAVRFGINKKPRSRVEMSELIQERLFKFFEEGKIPVIIVDEAQLIPGKKTFEEIRLLTNFQLDDTNLFSLILIGQSELFERLKGSPYRALRQRFGMRFHLEPLTKDEVYEYVKFRLEKAGGSADIFSSEAVELIYKYSEGIPRVINNIASSALIEGFAREKKVIDGDIIEDVVRELGVIQE